MSDPTYPTVRLDQPNPVADELAAARSEVALIQEDENGRVDRDTVLALLRTRIDRRVFIPAAAQGDA